MDCTIYVTKTKALNSCVVTHSFNHLADLHLCFCICKNSFSHDVAHLIYTCMLSLRLFTRGIKHDFSSINIRKVPREVLKTEDEARGFQPSWGTLRMLMNDKFMFDRYYCINSLKHCENEENIGALYFIASSQFPTRVAEYTLQDSGRGQFLII